VSENKTESKHGWTPVLMFLVIWAFVSWLTYVTVATKMIEAGLPGVVVLPSFVFALILTGFAMKPIFVQMLSGFLDTLDEIFKNK
jgi:hypothetical protein